MRSLLAPVFLVTTTLVAAAVAACGGGNETGPGTQVPSATPSATAPVTASATPTASGTATASSPPTVGPMNPIKASGMADELKGLGLDPKKLPPLAKIEPEKLRKVMKIISNSLGTQCTGCHDANDFRAWTPNKKVASHMWNDWVRGFAMNDGSVLFCDSCHQGHMKFLDRGDKKALGKWMEANFVTPLKRLDKKDHACATCHGEDFDPKFLDKWEAEAKK